MTSKKQLWRYVRALAAPLLLWTIFVIFLIKPLQTWLQGDRDYDEAAMQEWLEETRGFHETLPEMVRDYLQEWTNTPSWHFPDTSGGSRRLREGRTQAVRRICPDGVDRGDNRGAAL